MAHLTPHCAGQQTRRRLGTVPGTAPNVRWGPPRGEVSDVVTWKLTSWIPQNCPQTACLRDAISNWAQYINGIHHLYSFLNLWSYFKLFCYMVCIIFMTTEPARDRSQIARFLNFRNVLLSNAYNLSYYQFHKFFYLMFHKPSYFVYLAMCERSFAV